MDTRKIAREVRLRHWAEQINNRNASGETVISWCAKQGINPKTYYYWQNQLRKTALKRIAVEQNGNERTSLLSSGFAEVKISDSPRPPLPEYSGRGEVRIEAAGFRITADSGYPAASLAELLKGLALSC